MSPMNHETLDRRSLYMHMHVAACLRAHPERLAEAAATLARWRATADERVQPALAEWAAILARGLEPTLAAALEPSEEGDRLRQSSPLLGLLNPRERWSLLRAFKELHAA
jgi:hypothetical protein